MKINIKKFKQLNTMQLYKIFKLRYDVFVLEQNSIYNKFDNNDFYAVHLYIADRNNIIAYLRLYKESKTIASFGRVIVDKDYRDKGYGRMIIQKGIDYIKTKWNVNEIHIEAQEYLKKLYESYGFKQLSEVFNDGGIPHINMILYI